MMQAHARQMGDTLWQVDAALGRATALAAERSGYKLSHFAAMTHLLDAQQPDYAL